METLQEKRLNLLNDTINHYNLSNRGIKLNHDCAYTSHSDNSQGCAIGRFIVEKELCIKLDNIAYCGNGSVTNPFIFDLLPDNLKELGKDFLGKIQNLHDGEYYWTLEGLSEKGQRQVEKIKEFIEIDE